EADRSSSWPLSLSAPAPTASPTVPVTALAALRILPNMAVPLATDRGPSRLLRPPFQALEGVLGVPVQVDLARRFRQLAQRLAGGGGAGLRQGPHGPDEAEVLGVQLDLRRSDGLEDLLDALADLRGLRRLQRPAQGRHGAGAELLQGGRGGLARVVVVVVQ